jgi:hypothetical protein
MYVSSVTHGCPVRRHTCAAPLRAASATRARASSFESYSIPHSPPPVLPRSNKVRTTPFLPAPRPHTAASHIRLHRRARAPPPCATTSSHANQPPSAPQRAHHAPWLLASTRRVGGCVLAQRLLVQSQDAPARFSAASRTDARSSSRGASKGTGPSAGACFPGVAAPLERGCRAARGQEGCWPEGGGADAVTRLLQKSCPVILCFRKPAGCVTGADKMLGTR